jgi:head-tail adaptor
MTALATFRHVMTLERPGPPELDPAGGYAETWTPLDPATWHCSIRQASPADVERIGGGTITTTTALVLRGRYHAELVAAGPAARARFAGNRVLEIASVHDRDERGIELELLAREVTGRAVVASPTGPR